MEKECVKCTKIKDTSQFNKNKNSKDGFQHWCRQRFKEHRHQNIEKVHERERLYRIRTEGKRLQYFIEYRKNNKEKIAKYHKSHRVENRKKISEQKRLYHYYKRHTDIQFKLMSNLRNRLYHALNGNYKTGSAVRDLGCSIAELKIWLENQFVDGMCWENWGRGEGKWNIDHIIPFHKVDLTKREDLLKVCHYTNLRPLWYIDNMSRTYEELEQYE
jgi:hypothetical protein